MIYKFLLSLVLAVAVSGNLQAAGGGDSGYDSVKVAPEYKKAVKAIKAVKAGKAGVGERMEDGTTVWIKVPDSGP